MVYCVHHKNQVSQRPPIKSSTNYSTIYLTKNFTNKRLKVFSGVDPSVSDENIRRVSLRLQFGEKVWKRLSPIIWTKGISFYLDCTGFTHKYNPYDQALAPRTMAWRKPNDGLNLPQTASGSHEESGGKVAYFLVAI